MSEGCKTRIDWPASAGALKDLSLRELEVLELMAAGRSNQAIASELFLSQHTVGTHVKHIFRKLGLAPAAATHRRVCAVLTYMHYEHGNHG